MAYDIPASLLMGQFGAASALTENVKVWGHSITKLECASHAVKCLGPIWKIWSRASFSIKDGTN